MDGFQGKLRRSLQARLLLWLSLSLIVTALIAGGASFLIAFVEANQIQDDQLRQTARLVTRYDFSPDHQSMKSLREDLAEEDALISLQRLGAPRTLYEGKPSKYIPNLPDD